MSLIYDDRRLLETRVRRLQNPNIHAQTPPSRTRRLLSNIEMQTDARRFGTEPVPASDVEVQANFLIVESRSAGMNFLAGRATYHLRPAAGEIKMSFKKVVLINNDRPLPTMSFLI